MIELWELIGEDDRRYSTFSWRTRMALRHKGLAFTTRPVLQSDKASIAFSDGITVPIIRDNSTAGGGMVTRDSWAIAEYLEHQYPTLPSLFGADQGLALSRFVNNWVDRVVIPAAFAVLACDAIEIQHRDDQSQFGDLVQRLTGLSVGELKDRQPENVKRLRRAVDPARATLKRQAWLSGTEPAYADFILFSVYQWARIVSPLQLLANDPVLNRWFETLLERHDGFGKNTPVRNLAD